MSNIINKTILAGLGALSLTREKVEEVVDDLVKRGEISLDEKPGVLTDLVKAAEKRKDEARGFIRKEVQKVLEALDIPTRQEMNTLREQIENLSKRQEEA
ncbi:MAG: hypothetical protein DRO40_10480 [Thermoprotei archaeon]|nr:MAG: hypothetical protein DRO40_10480 [Thermoprotei archaeon]